MATSTVTLARTLALGDAAVAGVSDADLNNLIEIASARMNPSAWGRAYQEAVALLALHYIATSPAARGTSAGGAVEEEQVGSWRRRYAVDTTHITDPWLGSSEYGRRYLSLQRTRAARAPFIVGPGSG